MSTISAISATPRAGPGPRFHHRRVRPGSRTVPREPAPAPRLNPTTNVQFSAQLLVAAEPRLTLSHVRRLKLVEAVDDLGNSLIPVEDAETMHNRYAGYLGMATGPVVQIQAQLRRPDGGRPMDQETARDRSR